MAVIKRIDCVQDKMCRLQGFIYIFMFLTVADSADPLSCSIVMKNIENKGISSIGVLEKPESGPICGEGSCCGNTLEQIMLQYSQSYVEHYIKEVLLKVSSLIETRARKFDELFRDMMNNSKQEFHDMFNRTYGKIYLQNAEVFSDFFNELEMYYNKGTVRLSETLDNFFGILYQRMFVVINAQYNFDDKYLGCVNEHMDEMKPFGDVPYKLSQQLRRSFVATRTFYKSLTRAAEAIKQLPLLRMEEGCLRHLTKMQYCSTCKTEMGTGACSKYCVDTISLCFKHHIQLSDGWDSFVDAIEKVADRLIGPYNIESVVEPLNIKISEAIMNFQESGAEVSQKIQTKCGPPMLKRPKRLAGYKDSMENNPNIEIPQETMKIGRGKKKHKKVQQEELESMPNLDKLIMEIKLKVKDTKQFWIQLPYQYCNNETISAGPIDNGKCWNGTSIGIYEKPKPEFVSTEIPIITEQIYVFNGLTDKLKKAYQGMEVEIIDDTEDSLNGSGSGSGYGSNEEDEEPEEHEQNSVFKVNNNKNEAYPTPPPFSSTLTPEVVRTSSANKNYNMSLTKALVQYILPIVLVWLGGAIKDML